MTRSPESLVSVKSGATSPSATKPASSGRRAIGVVRVSEVGDRETLTLDHQRQRIEDWCARERHDLIDVLPEEDVSGGRPLEKRTGLRPAVEAIEDGRADLIVVAYFDRLVRSLTVQAEVLDRVESAGGRVVALDVGEVSASTSAQWLSSTFLGAVAEYHRRATAERTEDAKRRAIERGEPPFERQGRVKRLRRALSMAPSRDRSLPRVVVDGPVRAADAHGDSTGKTRQTGAEQDLNPCLGRSADPCVRRAGSMPRPHR